MKTINIIACFIFILFCSNLIADESTQANDSLGINKRPSIVLYSDVTNSEKIELSVMSRKQIQKTIDWFELHYNPTLIDFNAKAQLFNYLLNKNNYLSGKFFVIGKIIFKEMPDYVHKLPYYTVPLVAIKENDEINHYIVDLFSSKKIYTVDEWKTEVLDESASTIDSEYMTNQYHFTTKTRNEHLTIMKPEDSNDFYRIMSDASIDL